MDFKNFRAAIVKWARTVSGVQAIWEQQSETRPPRPYISLKVIAGPKLLGDDDLRQDSPGAFSVQGLRELTVSINTYGEDAIGIAGKLQTSLGKPSVLAQLRASGVSVSDIGAVQDLTIALDDRFESRANLDCRFYTANVEADDGMTIIETAIVNDQTIGV